MDKLVRFICGFWLWLTRRSLHYHEIGHTLHSAWIYLWSDYANRASTQERGSMLPSQIEALTLLRQQSSRAFQTSRRLQSLRECYEFVGEELDDSSTAA